MLYKSLWVIDDKKIHKTLLNYTSDIRNYQKGSYIYNQEDKQANLFFLLNGRIKVSLSDSNGSEKTLAIHEPGSFFGETAFFDEKPCFTDALVLEDSYILAFNKNEFSLLFEEQPEIIYNLFQSLGRKMRLLSFQVEYLSFMKIEQRVVALLLTLFKTSNVSCIRDNKPRKEKCNYSNSCIQGHILKLKITDQEIANMIGTRREAVTKAISNLKKQNLLYKKNRMICCPNLSRLEDILLE